MPKTRCWYGLLMGCLLLTATSCNQQEPEDRFSPDQELERSLEREFAGLFYDTQAELVEWKETLHLDFASVSESDVLAMVEQRVFTDPDWMLLEQRAAQWAAGLGRLSYASDEEKLASFVRKTLRAQVIDKIAPQEVVLRSTPCYESWEISVYGASAGYGICLLTKGYTMPGAVACTAAYGFALLFADESYDNCLEQTY